jgi:hypothetical protein
LTLIAAVLIAAAFVWRILPTERDLEEIEGRLHTSLETEIDVTRTQFYGSIDRLRIELKEMIGAVTERESARDHREKARSRKMETFKTDFRDLAKGILEVDGRVQALESSVSEWEEDFDAFTKTVIERCSKIDGRIQALESSVSRWEVRDDREEPEEPVYPFDDTRAPFPGRADPHELLDEWQRIRDEAVDNFTRFARGVGLEVEGETLTYARQLGAQIANRALSVNTPAGAKLRPQRTPDA